jgi:hypothetical protein
LYAFLFQPLILLNVSKFFCLRYTIELFSFKLHVCSTPPEIDPDASVPIGTFWNSAMQKIKFEHLKFVSIDYCCKMVIESQHVSLELLSLAVPLLEKVHIRAKSKNFILVKKLVGLNGASKEAEIHLFD